MHDTLSYISRDPIYRKYHHDQLTLSLTYAFAENFVLPISHDEVVHGKGSLLAKMPGDHWQKFANLRTYFAFMFTHPGKKLLFMGCEFGQQAEWNHDASLDWHLLADPLHAGIQRLVRDLNAMYRQVTALHERDCAPSGFEWIDCTDWEKSILCFLRRGRAVDDVAVVVCNFTPEIRYGYRVGVMVTSLSPGGGVKMSKHTVRGGDVAGLLKRFAQLREKAKGRTGKVFPARCSPTSAGNRAFARWCGCRRLKMKTDAGFAVSARC